MKINKKCIVLGLSLAGIFALVSCGNSHEATGTLSELVATTNKLEFSAKVKDPAGEVVANSVIAQVLKDGKQVNQTTLQSLPKKDSNGNWESQTATFSSLEESQKYKIVLKCTIDKESVTLDEKEFETAAKSTKDNPISLKSEEDLKNIKNDAEGYYTIDNDIEMTSSTFEPLFTSSSPFKGHIDGKNHKIKNFKQSSSYEFLGLLGYMAKGSEVENLDFEDANINLSRGSNTKLGVIAGCSEGLIENCHITGSLRHTTTSSSYASVLGGIVGELSGSIKNSSFDGKIEGDSNVSQTIGGLVGIFNPSYAKSVIENSFANAEIIETQKQTSTGSKDAKIGVDLQIGGLVGYNNGKISNCYVEGSIKNTSTMTAPVENQGTTHGVIIGGLIGLLGDQGYVEQSFASNDITYESFTCAMQRIGLLIGYVKNSSTPSNISEVLYIGKNKTVKIDLFKDEATTEEEITLNDRKVEYNTIARYTDTFNLDDTKVCVIMPSEVLSKLCPSGEKLSNKDYNTFNFSETLKTKIASLIQ
jgi:uncharacterized membrane protein (UPF0136 family)